MAGKTVGPHPDAARARGQATRAAGASVISWPVLLIAFLAVVVAVVTVGLALRGGRPASSGAIAALQTGDFHALAFSSDNPNIVFLGHHNGILRSQDGGRTWSSLVDQPNFDAMILAASRANGRQVYQAGHDMFQVSTDRGVTWQPLVHNLPGTDIHGFAISPDDPNRLYALVVDQGLFSSANGGRIWRSLTVEVPGDVLGLAAAGGDPETLYASSMRFGVLWSIDGGRSWKPTPQSAGTGRVLALAVDPTAHQTIYAGGEDGLHKSMDRGATWKKLPFPGDNATALAISPLQPNVVLAISVQGQRGLVYRSEDGGQTWGQRW